VRDEFVRHVLGRLAPVGPVEAKPMFGGWGLYLGETFFAIVHDDALYLRAEGADAEPYRAAGMSPFLPVAGKKPMAYWEVPLEVLEEPEELAAWSERALRAARRAPRKQGGAG
jgi:DNA transformation protein